MPRRIPRLVSAVVVVGATLGLTACSDSPPTTGMTGPAASSVEAPAPGVTLASSDGSGLALEGVVLVRAAIDIVEFRADLANRGAASVDVGGVVERLRRPSGEGALSLASEDGGKRLYPLVRVDPAGGGGPDGGGSTPLAPGASQPLTVRFGPIGADVGRLTPVVPGFAPAPPIQIAEIK